MNNKYGIDTVKLYIEMTNFYDDPMDENGNYHYGHFDEYFIDPKRKAYFIYGDDKLAKAIKSALAKEHEK